MVDSVADTVVVSAEDSTCVGDHLLIEGEVFFSGTTLCVGYSSITLGEGVVVEAGAGLDLSAPVVRIMSNVVIEKNAVFKVSTIP